MGKTKLIKNEKNFKYCDFMNRWFRSRVIKNNKNIIGVFTGPTGSGKTYSCLSQAESWHEFQFDNKFNPKNICFDLGALVKRINYLKTEGKLKKGDIFILEEAGANFGNLDFQNKLAKMFSYILQSFRSMNLILLMTVPVLTMINKSARQLIHVHLTTESIDFGINVCKAKPHFHQLAQSTGKSYWKFPRVRRDGQVIKIEIVNFPKPSKELIEVYEIMKEKFVVDLTQEFIDEYDKQERLKIAKESRKELTYKQLEVFELLRKGMNQTDIAKKLGKAQPTISEIAVAIKKKGYSIVKPLENVENRGSNPIQPPT